MEMNMAKFSEKLVELLELAKKKKNVLEYQEISDHFPISLYLFGMESYHRISITLISVA